MSSPPVVANGTRWWRGARGEWLVVIQIVLIGLVFLGPRSVAGHPSWAFPFPDERTIVGAVLMAAGCLMLVAGLVRLGRGLTPLPYPRESAELIQTGPYGLVRHPMYAGGLVLAFGWTLHVGSWLTLLYAAVLFVFLDMKSRREEKWLTEKFPAYPAYQQRVRKLIPFVY
jgi:protein-S-isoprenylcysteine O-methyltransferase Ste14